MSKKILVAGIHIGLVIGLPIGYFAPQFILNPSSSNSEYIEVRVEANASASNSAVEKFGGYNYYFLYTPDNVGGLGFDGYIVIQREATRSWTYQLGTDITQRYQEIEFKITEIQPNYCILMAKYSP